MTTIIIERLRTNMNDRAMSQSELARRINVDRAHVSNLLAGKRTPSLELAVKIARELDCSIDFLVGLDTVPNRK